MGTSLGDEYVGRFLELGHRFQPLSVLRVVEARGQGGPGIGHTRQRTVFGGEGRDGTFDAEVGASFDYLKLGGAAGRRVGNGSWAKSRRNAATVAAVAALAVVSFGVRMEAVLLE